MLFERMRFLLVILMLTGISCTTGAESKCPADEFQCKNGECVQLAWRCDGAPECKDGSDELDCPSTTCTGGSFQCDNGKCITATWLCDGHADCTDASDEKKEICSSCPDDNFKCDNGQCITTASWVCDEHEDCEDGSDEKPEICKNRTCDNAFRCEKSGRCISASWRCDGPDDCDDGSDEKGCPPDSLCGDDEFTCANHECISKKWRCDHHKDCDDGSDEEGCVKSKCKEGQFSCKDGGCISDMWRCDGDDDCDDGSDEANCTEPANGTCEPDEFRCLTPLIEAYCIHLSWKCDGDSDCADDSDEDCEERTCAPDEVMCREDKYCIKKLLLCDQQHDCRDKSDEENCPEPELKCEDNKFDCYKNGSICIPRSQVCDGRPDCHNHADEATELGCPENNLCKKDNGGCQQECIVNTTHPDKRSCGCFDGYEMEEGSETKCKDIDECELPGTCSQICKNLPGTYKCECEEGYGLVHNRFCKATVGQPVELFLSDSNDLRRYRLDTNHYTLLVDSSPSGAKAMDFDIREQKVYWRGSASKNIFSSKLQSGQIDEIPSDKESDPTGIAVDWVNHNLYVTDSGHDVISVSKLDGTHRHTLVSGEMDEPQALVLDPYQGWMYWTDWGLSPKIEKCGMNGKHRKVIRQNDIVWPNGLTIDYVSNRLYWVDAKMHIIASSDLNGEAYQLIHRSHERLGHPYSITVFEDFLYWSDWIDNAVHKINKFGSGEVTTIAPDLKTPYDIRVYHIYRQPSAKSPCENNGGCSHLCLPTPKLSKRTTYQSECACPDGLILKNMKTCVGPTGPVCAVGKFDCFSNGTVCIDKSKVCDETADCPNSADEAVEHCGSVKPEAPNTPSTPNTHNTTAPGEGAAPVTAAPKDDSKGMGKIALIVIPVIIVCSILVGLVIYLMMRRYRKKNKNSMNFDNPVYRKTTTDEQLILDKEARANQRQESMQPLNEEPEIV